MSTLEKRLKDDAAAIDGDVPPGLRARIDAAIADTEPQRARPARSSLWLLATGAAACAVLAVVLLNGNRETFVDDGHAPVLVATRDVPDEWQTLPLDSVVLTEPLQQELHNLRADIDRARATIERDLRKAL